MLINLFRSAFDQIPESIIVESNVSINEALKFDYENSIIAVNGNEVDEDYILRDNDVCTIREFPKATAVGITALTVGITAGTFFVANEIVKAASGKSIGAWIKEGLMKWLAPDASDTAANSAESLESIPQLRGAKNQSNRNKPIPIVLGRHLYTPMFLGTPYTEIGGVDGEDQYYNALYLLGWGKLKVNEVRLGPVSGLAKNAPKAGYPHGVTDGMLEYIKGDRFCDPSYADSNPLLELRQGANSDRLDGEVGLYPQRVVEERLNIELMNIKGNDGVVSRNEPIRFSAKNPQKVQVEITLNNGLISYNDNGVQNASVDIRLEWRDYPRDNDEEGWKEFGRFGTIGGQSPTTYNSATRTTTITRQKAKVMRFIAERSFSWAEIDLAINRTIEIRAIRTNSKNFDDTRTADTVFLTAIRTWCFDNETEVGSNGQKAPQAPMITRLRDQTARLGFRIKATDILQGTLDALNCMVESYAKIWNGTEWSDNEEPTNNPASVALKIMQSPALGRSAYPNYMLDLDSFGEFYEWCEEREYSSNGVLISERRVDELLNAVLSTGRGMRMLNGNRYAVLIDKPRENPVHILNNQNVLEASNHKSFEDLPDGFSIKFINESDGYQETEVYVMADGSSTPKPDSRIESIEILYVTDYKQIVKLGWYLLACRHLRPEIWYRKLSTDGYLLGIGSRVEVQDDTIVVGIGEGAEIKNLVIENGIITEIQTDGVFDVTDATQRYGIKIMQFDGYSKGKVRTIEVPINEPGIYRNFSVNIPLYDTPVPSVGDIISFGIYNRITTSAICFGKKSNEDGTFDVTLIPYQEGIYTTDSGQIPPYQANITTPQGLVPPPAQDHPTLSETIEIARGFAGDSALVLDLSNQFISMRADHEGNILPHTEITSQATLYNGINIASGVLWSLSSMANIVTNDGDLIVTNDGDILTVDIGNISIDQSGLITIHEDYTQPVDRVEVNVLAEYMGVTRTTIMTIQKVRGGANGEAAVIFELQPSVDAVVRNSAGLAAPNELSCKVNRITGSSGIITDDRSKVIQYITSKNPTWTNYSYGDKIPIPSERLNGLIYIEFRLLDGSTIIDIERVPIVQEGQQGRDGTPDTIYIRGTGLNKNASRRLIIRGESIYDNAGRGLRVTAMNRNTLAVVSERIFDTYGAETSAFISHLDTLNNTVFVCITSYDAGWHSVAGGHVILQKLRVFGSNGVIADNQYARTPFAFLGFRGLNQGMALEVMTSPDATANYAEISTNIINGQFSGSGLATTSPAPRYRGLVRRAVDADTGNTGAISTNQGTDLRMNHNDFVMFVGNQIGDWMPPHIYQWNNDTRRWAKIPLPSDGDVSAGWMYIIAANTIEKGEADLDDIGIFSNVFCQALTTTYAFITNLFMQNGILRQGGSIESEEKDASGNPLFKLWANGLFEAMRANISGGISAGGVWNIDGSDKNPNNQGGLWIPGYSTRGRFKNFDLMGQLMFGPSGKPAYVEFNSGYVKRQPQVPHHLHLQFLIHGNYTLTSLNTAIINATGTQPANGCFFPISGKILLQTGISGGSPIYERIWISGARSGTPLTLYGIGENSNTLRTISLNGTTNVIASIAII